MDQAGGIVHRGGIAKAFGLSLQRITTITGQKGFPDPYVTLGGRPIWIVADVKQWADENGRTYSEPRDRSS